MPKKSLFEGFNFLILIPVVLLLIYSTMMVLSTVLSTGSPLNSKLFLNQLLNVTLGLGLYFIFAQIDYHLYYHFYTIIFVVMAFLLILIPVMGYVSHGAVRWFDLGFFNLQPSEISKLFLILSLGSFLVRFKKKLPRIFFFLLSLLFTGFITILVFIQPDLGTSMVMMVIWIVMYYMQGMKIEEIVFLLVAAGIALPVGWGFLHDYQKDRLFVFLDPQKDPLGKGYAVLQSIIAVGAGQLLGMGWGRGTQSKLQFLPERQTDFMFATISEEMGFVGIFLLILLFALIMIGILSIIKKTQDPYGKLIASGVFGWFLFQFLINIGMNMGIMPVTGIPLPFVSYGGSSLVSCMISLGILQSINRYQED